MSFFQIYFDPVIFNVVPHNLTVKYAKPNEEARARRGFRADLYTYWCCTKPNRAAIQNREAASLEVGVGQQ